MDASFIRDGDRYVPTPLANGPWAPGVLHGGPAAGLMARAIEQYQGDPEMQVVRLTIDLFRSIPSEPLEVRVESARKSHRLHALQSSLFAGDVELARTNALALRRSEVPPVTPIEPPPPGPQGLPLGRMMRGQTERPGWIPGFHSAIEVAWVSDIDADVATAWLHVPFPLVAGEETSSLVAAASLADFAMQGRKTDANSPWASYINPDITLYLHRQPVGDWFCLQSLFRAEAEGVGRTETVWYDTAGRYGLGVQARLFNPRKP